MSPSLVRAVRWGAIAAGVIAYPVLAHYSAASAAAAKVPSLGVAVSLTPPLAILAWLTWRSTGLLGMLLLCAGMSLVLCGSWGALERNFGWVYFIQHAGTNVLLAALFGVSLMHGRDPLCTRLAEAVRGSLGSEVVRYTRQVTRAWALFFVGMSLVSAGLFWFGSIEAWSVFANFLSLPLVLLMFVAEHLVRLHKLPHLEQHSIMESILAFRRTPKVCPSASARPR